MTVRWTTDAADDLERICDYLGKSRPESAGQTAQNVFELVASLEQFPNLGRLGRVEGTRELVTAPLPFVIVYEVKADTVRVLRILHGAQQWPPTH